MALCTKVPCEHVGRNKHCVTIGCPNSIFNCPEHKISTRPGD